MNKLDELSCKISEFDVVLITESWLKGSDVIGRYTGGFIAYRQDRTDRAGGGCLLLVRDYLPQSPISTPSQFDELQVVSCVLHVSPPIQILGIYRSPKSSPTHDTVLLNFLRESARSSYRLCIMGDLNAPKIDWVSRSPRGSDFERALIDVLDRQALVQHVLSTTRSRQNQTSSTLDLVLSRREDDVSDLTIGDPLGKSDHYTIAFHFILYSPVSCINFYRPFHKIDRSSLSKAACGMTWSASKLDRTWPLFHENFMKLTDQFAPLTKTGGRNKKPWLTASVKKALKLKRLAWSTYADLKESWAYDRYKKLRNKAISVMRRSRFKYEVLIANTAKINSKRYFAYAKLKSKQKDSVSAVLCVNGEKFEDDRSITEVFCGYFCSVFRVATHTKLPLVPYVSQPHAEVTAAEVQCALKGLSPWKSAGPDGIHPAVLIPLGPMLLDTLVEMFNHSLEACFLPVAWKAATVVPIFKGGDKTQPSSYRPVSLTSIVVKLLERIIRNRICEFLQAQGFFNSSQHGFLKGRSCLTNLLAFFDRVTQLLDEGKAVDVCYLDFQKAFDSVNHELLIWKLRDLNIDSTLCDWIEEFLRNRTFQVKVRNVLSKTASPTSGVPQGSILGPLLFLIYINDITVGLDSPCFLYADDIKLVGDSSTPVLQADLMKLVDWTQRWDLPLNALKCHLLTSALERNISLPLSSGSHQLNCVDSAKDLGIVVSSKFTPSSQCEAAAAKALKTLFSLRSVIVNRTSEVLLPLYSAIVRPHLEYCVQAWAPYLKKDIAVLERVQRLATRMMLDICHLTYQDRLIKLNLFSLERRRLRGDLIEVFKYSKDPSGSPVGHLFALRKDSGLRGHSLTLSKVRSRLAVRFHFFANRVVNAWNKLPTEVVLSSSVERFKVTLDAVWAGIFPELI